MGSYVPRRKTKPKSISEALIEAESDHLLDCPTADFWIRTAAILLDGIFFWLLWSGVKHIFSSLGPALLSHFPQTLFPMRTDQIIPFMTYVAQGMLYFFYFCGTVARFGGSPGKLLLGLKIIDARTGLVPSFEKALARELFGKVLSTAILAMGWGMAFLREDSRTLHDLIAGTTVKRVINN